MDNDNDIAEQPISADRRAQMIVDSIGMVSEGDYRQRVFDAALLHIRNAVALALSQRGAM